MANKINIYKKQRDAYKPKKINYIFIFESPPINGEYFYDISGSQNETLFRNMMLTLFNQKFDSKEKGLKFFKKYGFLLVDLSYKPVNGINNRNERIDVLKSHFDNLLEDLKLLVSKQTKIILVMRHVTDICLEKNLGKNFKVINPNLFVPFPNHYHFLKFKSKIRKLIFDNEKKYIQIKE